MIPKYDSLILLFQIFHNLKNVVLKLRQKFIHFLLKVFSDIFTQRFL